MRKIGLVVFLVASVARADRQSIAPGTGRQDSVVVDSGANGVCETTAARTDVQSNQVGHGLAFTDAVRCGPDRIANTAAAGDDTQLVAVGSACRNAGEIVVDTGPDGIANSAAVGDDVQLVPVGAGAPNTSCVETGPNGIADTAAVAGDDVRLLAQGAAEAHTPVIRCGPNRVAETFANNLKGGDDVQLVGVGAPCPASNTVVVDSGANGIAETRAQGPELVLALANPRPVKLTIRRRKSSASARVKLAVFNREFGSAAPPSRAYTLAVDDGSCPGGTVSAVDADTGAAGVSPTASVPLGRRVKATFVVTLKLADVTTVDRHVPFVCIVNVEADAVDTAPAPDDASNSANNGAAVTLVALDENDL